MKSFISSKKNIVILSFLLFSCGSLMAQSEYDKFLDAAREAISKGDCDRAQKQYNNYKYVTNKTDADIEYKIKKCKESKMAKSTPAPVTKTQKPNSGVIQNVSKPDKQPTTGTLNGHEWIDLGLPSGTWWKDKNESGFYDYDAAVRSFGSKLPTKEQLEELKNSCQWTWTGSGYKVVGPSGASIVLPAAGWRYCGGGVNFVGSYGYYWSSTPDGSDYAWDLGFKFGKVDTNGSYRCYGHSVRLVQD